MFSFFKKKPDSPIPPAAGDLRTMGAARVVDVALPPAPTPPAAPTSAAPAAPSLVVASAPTTSPQAHVASKVAGDATPAAPAAVAPAPAGQADESARKGWLDRLKVGLRRTGNSITTVFTGTQIDDALYEDLEAALLQADAGVAATQHLLDDLKRRVKAEKVTEPAAVKALLIDAITDLLRPLEKGLVIGEHQPTVIMVTGVNGAGKTTSIGKLTKHLADHGAHVLLAAADTFRAAAKEQLLVWADRNQVEIISQDKGDPAAVSYDAVSAGKARGKDVVIVDTAGRLPTQTHLMEELKKIKRTIAKADTEPAPGRPKAASAPSGGSEPREAGSVGANVAPHEVLLVIDGNTGQNGLAQVKSFDEAVGLTGLIITKLDGSAKGGVLAAIALWSQSRAQQHASHRGVPVYFIGVGEKLADLETFNAREFAQALLA